jgi:5-methylcytosine-specific restriction endonuclease McrA
MKTYAEKLQDPRWQRKRLEIMKKDDFKCAYCASENQKLNVHHRYYVSGRDPWLYPDWSLVTLCDSCHKGYHSHSECNFYTWESFLEGLSAENYGQEFVNFMWEIMNAKTNEDKSTAFARLLEIKS